MAGMNECGLNPSQARGDAQDFTEFIIQRKEPGHRVTADKDFLDGFVISGPGLNRRTIRFIEWSRDATAEADTPWGRMVVRWKQPNKWQWLVTRDGESPVDVEMKYLSYVDFFLSNNVKLRFKNRTLLVLGGYVYRFKDRSGTIEIRTETTGLLSNTPFPSERKKIWKIRFKGQLSMDCRVVLPPLALWLCYYKIVRRGDPAFYDNMF
jgi:hypothetical protein